MTEQVREEHVVYNELGRCEQIGESVSQTHSDICDTLRKTLRAPAYFPDSK